MIRTHRSIRVLICNRYSLFRDGLRAIIHDQDLIKVVGEAATGRKAIDQAQHLRPDVVLMDTELSDLSGFETMARIHAIDPNIRVLILTLSDDSQSKVSRFLEAGAMGEIGRKDAPSQLRAAIIAAAGRRGAEGAIATGSLSRNLARHG